ncbi:MAG: hypothetical protein KatS3mg028_1326 [Bacteroidia bacterium]|nr:MAG: hypothetical protein KatS3mg028_1326 [Bacteroidia bacterium]
MKGKLFLVLCSSWIAGCFFVSCNNPILHNKKSEGVIEYKVEAVDKLHPLAGLAPDKAVLKFKDDKYRIEMSTMGVFKTIFILDGNKKTLTEMIKFMDIKNACIETQEDLIKEANLSPLKFKSTNEEIKIAGYKAKKLIAYYVYNPPPADSFEVLYTTQLEPKNIYDLSAYKGINGMLMKYRLKKWGLELEFTAQKVSLEQVPDEEFELPSYYKIISKEEMEKFIKDLQ